MNITIFSFRYCTILLHSQESECVWTWQLLLSPDSLQSFLKYSLPLFLWIFLLCYFTIFCAQYSQRDSTDEISWAVSSSKTRLIHPNHFQNWKSIFLLFKVWVTYTSAFLQSISYFPSYKLLKNTEKVMQGLVCFCILLFLVGI